MKIIELYSENVKRLRAVTISPTDPVVVIGGNNGQGKSSVIDSIFYALGGKDALPLKPVHEGATHATIRVTLDDFTVERRIAPDRSSSLRITGKDGGKLASPQALLDRIVGDLTFDPLAFAKMKPPAQVEALRKVAGLDEKFATLDRQRAAKMEARTLLGRDVDKLAGSLATMPRIEDAPRAEVDVGGLMAQLREAQAARDSAASQKAKLRNAEEEIRQCEESIADLESQLRTLQEALAGWKTYRDKQSAYVASLPDHAPTIAAIEAQIAGASEANRKHLHNQQRAKIAQEHDQAKAAYETLTAAIRDIAAQKEALLAAAAFPVPGLSFNADGVTMNGQPFEQASAAEQLRASVAMGAAVNPELKILLVRDGSLLDADSMRMLAEMAKESDMQVWLERVGAGDENAIIIEDGELAPASWNRRKTAAKGTT
jgi:hypothetical protein